MLQLGYIQSRGIYFTEIRLATHARLLHGHLAMKTFLRDPITQQYLMRDKHWTPDAEKAKVFGEVDAALRYCIDKRLPHLEIVLRLPQSQTDSTRRPKKAKLPTHNRLMTVRKKSFAQSV